MNEYSLLLVLVQALLDSEPGFQSSSMAMLRTTHLFAQQSFTNQTECVYFCYVPVVNNADTVVALYLIFSQSFQNT